MLARSAILLFAVALTGLAPGEAATQLSGDARDRRIVVSVAERRLWLLEGLDTVLSAPVAVGKGLFLSDGARIWDFATPRGERRVLGKEENPVWVPPDWHYVETARREGLGLVWLRRGRQTRLPDGTLLAVLGDEVVRLRPGGTVERLPSGEEIIFGDTLYAPPLGTAQRRIAGELGSAKLVLGDGYLIHGTPDEASIGSAATHGCIRMRDADLRILYRHVPVGTPVEIR